GNDGSILIIDRRAGLLRARGERIEAVAGSDVLPRSYVITMAQTPNGDIWLGTRDSGLVRLRGGQVTLVRNGLPDQKINCLAPEGPDDLWIGTDGGVARWDGHEVTQAGLPDALRQVRVATMIKDRDANLWIGTTSGLIRLNRGGLTPLDRGRPGSGVTAL